MVTALMPVVTTVLKGAARALRLTEIEVKVRDLEITVTVNGQKVVVKADTFDIRDAVNELIAAGKAVFDQPGYKVKLKELEDGETNKNIMPQHTKSE
jgi:hypothetical protein